MKFYCRNCEEFLCEDPVRDTQSDPFGTGDSWFTETTYICPTCRLDELEELAECNTCGERLPFDIFDDCAECMVSEAHAHDKIYEEIDYQQAREALKCSED